VRKLSLPKTTRQFGSTATTDSAVRWYARRSSAAVASAEVVLPGPNRDVRAHTRRDGVGGDGLGAGAGEQDEREIRVRPPELLQKADGVGLSERVRADHTVDGRVVGPRTTVCVGHAVVAGDGRKRRRDRLDVCHGDGRVEPGQ
jgi:hypothetical protein